MWQPTAAISKLGHIMQDLKINHNLTIKAAEFTFTFARSSGPGGQNVNKVNSKAILCFDLALSPSLSEPIKQRFFTLYASKMNQDGSLTITADESRDQRRNQMICLEKLRQMLQEALKPIKKRKPTKPTKASKEKRHKNKQLRSDTKKNRQKIPC